VLRTAPNPWLDKDLGQSRVCGTSPRPFGPLHKELTTTRRTGSNTEPRQLDGWQPGGGRGTIAPSAMRKIVPAALLFVLLGALAYWALRVEPTAPEPLRPGTEAVEASGAVPAVELTGPAGRPSAPGSEADVSRPAPAAGGSASGTPRASIDEPQAGTRAPLVVTVIDTGGAPVEGALVALESVRAASSGRSHLVGATSGALTARTDEHGEASVRYPVTVAGGELTAFVSFTVEHPEFFSFREPEHAVDTGRATATLERGAQVVVSGWIDTPEEIVRDVEPVLSFGARAGPRAGLRPDDDAWHRTKDGRLSAGRFLPGQHRLMLTHVAPDGTHYASEIETLALADTERKLLHLRLLATPSLEGRLSFDVPRPVVSGRVLVALQSGSPHRSDPRIHIRRSADVAADGTFKLDGLPPLRGEIVAACDGWVSALLPTRDLDRLGVTRADDEVIAEAQRRMGARALAQQELDLGADEGPFVLEMQPAPRLVVEVQTPDGKPLADARVTVLARVRWSIGVSEPWVGTLAHTTDEHGRATFATLPPGVHEVLVESDGFVLPLAENRDGRPNRNQDRSAAVTLGAGLELLLTLRMERP